MLRRSDDEIEESARKDKEARKTHWRDLLRQLRAANPSQKIVYREAGDVVVTIVIDGAEVEVRLDEKRAGSPDSWRARRGTGIYYFTVGRHHRHGGARPRAMQKKAGFDWARLAQLIEDERKYVAAKVAGEKSATETLARANVELDALFKRRADLEDLRCQLDISSRTGRFTYTARDMGVDALERVLDIARAIDNMNGDEPVGDESLKSLAERINEYLRRFEADKKINARDPDIGGLQPYYNAGARYYGGSRLRVIYVSFQGGSMLTRDEAMRYLTKLDAGFVGRHHEALR